MCLPAFLQCNFNSNKPSPYIPPTTIVVIIIQPPNAFFPILMYSLNKSGRLINQSGFPTLLHSICMYRLHQRSFCTPDIQPTRLLHPHPVQSLYVGTGCIPHTHPPHIQPANHKAGRQANKQANRSADEHKLPPPSSFIDSPLLRSVPYPEDQISSVQHARSTHTYLVLTYVIACASSLTEKFLSNCAARIYLGYFGVMP